MEAVQRKISFEDDQQPAIATPLTKAAAAAYNVSRRAFTDSGDYNVIWSVSVPAHTSREGCMGYQACDQTARSQFDTKIHVEEGYKLEASLNLHFEVVDRLKGTDNVSSAHDIAKTSEETVPKTRHDNVIQNNPSIITLPATRRVDTVLAFVLLSVMDGL
ncbi:hypothetical protein BGZ94_003096 [Podila epigama]|nr:hypothetical protein BGZ94_003096 [Podila epigama]